MAKYYLESFKYRIVFTSNDPILIAVIKVISKIEDDVVLANNIVINEVGFINDWENNDLLDDNYKNKRMEDSFILADDVVKLLENKNYLSAFNDLNDMINESYEKGKIVFLPTTLLVAFVNLYIEGDLKC